MFTKMKVALVLCGSLLCGVAAAQGTGGPPVDRAEMKAKRMAKKQEMLQKFDTNKDGQLDQAERTAARDIIVSARFAKLDTDRNGVLSLAEFKAGKQGKMGKFGKRHARGGGFHKRGMGPK